MPESVPICGVVAHCGPQGAPLACGYPPGHDGPHAWATLPTVVPAHDPRAQHADDPRPQPPARGKQGPR